MEIQLYLYSFFPIFAVGFITWILSVIIKDVSIVDSAWSLMFLAAAVYIVCSQSGYDTRSIIILSLVSAWAIRLFLHLTIRNWGEEEDRRYRDIRKKYNPNFAFKSLFIIFLFQAILAWVIFLPLWPALTLGTPFQILDVLGIIIWSIGFTLESVADWQLARFTSDKSNQGKVLNTGLWRFSRHPNYFGECLIWWGFFCFALSAGAWWSILGPLLITWLLLKFSGVVMLEETIVKRRPAYQAYIDSTSAFFPWLPKQ